MKNKTAFFLLLSIMVVAFNLRAAITAVGPLVGLIREDLGISNGVAGFITTIPLVFFALGSSAASFLGNLFGLESTIFGGLFLIFLGILLRSYTGMSGFFLGTAVIGCGIAIGNVLMPAFIKERFPDKVGLITSLYSASMTVMASISVAISLPLANFWRVGWKNSLAVWSLPALGGLILWWPWRRERIAAFPSPPDSRRKKPAPFPKIPHRQSKTSVYLSLTAWQVTIFTGLQSLLFYCFVAWLPSILLAKGVYEDAAGTLSLLYLLVSIPANILVPVLCGRRSGQRPVAFVFCLIYLIGMIGFLFATSRQLLIFSIVLCGLGMGACISYSICLIGLRSSSAWEASRLSGMAQTVGYLLAALGPTLIGTIYDVTASWTLPILLFIGGILLMSLFALRSGEDKPLFQGPQD